MKTMTETTPIFEALIASLGNPVPTPAIDRSYAALVAEALAPLGSLPAPSSARKTIAAVGKSIG